eukprot:6478160-Amphidinium_carterae.6
MLSACVLPATIQEIFPDGCPLRMELHACCCQLMAWSPPQSHSTNAARVRRTLTGRTKQIAAARKAVVVQSASSSGKKTTPGQALHAASKFAGDAEQRAIHPLAADKWSLVQLWQYLSASRALFDNRPLVQLSICYDGARAGGHELCTLVAYGHGARVSFWMAPQVWLERDHFTKAQPPLRDAPKAVSYTHLRAHETEADL